MEAEHVANRFRLFAELEAKGNSPIYHWLANAVAGDAHVLDLITRARSGQPNLFLGVTKYLGAPYDSWDEFKGFTLARADEVLDLMATYTTQTNEVGRCATLLPLLARLPQPLALLEVGTSAGLCLFPDRYGYRYRGAADIEIGDLDSPVILDCELRGAVPPPSAPPTVAWRRGIDIKPIDVRDDAATRWLEACVWPGQPERLDRLRSAIAVARQDPPVIIEGDLVECIEDAAARAPKDATLVIFHSAVLGYLKPDRRRLFADKVGRIDATWIAAEGPTVVSHPTTPLPDLGRFLVTVNGTDVVAHAHAHGRWLEWVG